MTCLASVVFFQTVLYTYSGLDKELFARYIEEKTDPIVGLLEQNMYRGMFDWNNCLPPTGEILNY